MQRVRKQRNDFKSTAVLNTFTGLPTLESSQIQNWLFKIRVNTSLSFQNTPEIRKNTCKTANLMRIKHTLMTLVDQITIF